MTRETTANNARRTRIAEAWTAAWDRGDLEPLEALLAPGYRRRGGAGDSDGIGREDYKDSIVSARAAFPDLATAIDDILVEGDRAAIRWHTRGTHLGSFLGVPPTKRPVEVHGATFARFEEDQVVEEIVTWDPRALLAGLGIITVGQDQ